VLRIRLESRFQRTCICTFVPVKQVNRAPDTTHSLRITFPDDVLAREFTTDFTTAIAHSLRITFPDDVLVRTQYWDAVLQLGEGPIVEWPREHAAGGSQGTRFTCFTGTKVQILTPEELCGRSRERCACAQCGAEHAGMLTYADVC
jgi:hypothetical protein